jgi:hypothetical protein
MVKASQFFLFKILLSPLSKVQTIIHNKLPRSSIQYISFEVKFSLSFYFARLISVLNGLGRGDALGDK